MYQNHTPEPMTEGILDAARAQLEAFGVRRLTVEDVARRAGVSRVTVYRKFGNRDALVQAVVQREAGLFFAQLESAIGGFETAANRLAEGFSMALDYLRNHSLLNRLLAIEPEAVVTLITISGGQLLGTARSHLADQIGRDVSEGRLPPLDVHAMAELLVRLVLSFFLMPETVFRLSTPDDAREFARRHLVPMIEGRALGEPGATLPK
jgi:AcrR family transcriptional regulator